MPPVTLSLTLVALAVAGLVAAVVRLALSRRRLTAELAATRQLFSRGMDLAPFCAYIKGGDGRYLYENPTLAAMPWGDPTPVTSFLGKTDLDIFPAEQARQYMDDDREVLQSGKPLVFHNRSINADGTERQWFTVKFPWIDERGRECVAGMSVDVSELRRAQATARVSNDRCTLALEAGRMGTMALDLATQMLDTSPQFALLHGRPETDTRLSLADSLAQVHPDDRQSIVAAVEAALRDRAPNRITYRVVKPDGGIAWLELMGQVYTDDAGRPTVVRGVGFDVTERQAAYDELARRKTILRRLIDVQENERQTLCHELHDGLIQYAIGAKMLLEAARDEADEALRAERIDAACDCLERGIAEGRQVIRGVRPAVLDDLGLVAALEDLAEQMAVAGITVELALDTDLDAVPPRLRTTIYRVVQESLTNARKHAGVEAATVEVRHRAGKVNVRVRDQGGGFDVEEARKRGFGLVGMTERVRLAGGVFWIESRPGAGTEINARLPIPAGDEPPPAAEQVEAETGAYATAPAFLPP